jgi:hypothetical protein
LTHAWIRQDKENSARMPISTTNYEGRPMNYMAKVIELQILAVAFDQVRQNNGCVANGSLLQRTYSVSSGQINPIFLPGDSTVNILLSV